MILSPSFGLACTANITAVLELACRVLEDKKLFYDFAKGVCWSPAGLAPDGGCVLIVVNVSGQASAAVLDCCTASRPHCFWAAVITTHACVHVDTKHGEFCTGISRQSSQPRHGGPAFHQPLHAVRGSSGVLRCHLSQSIGTYYWKYCLITAVPVSEDFAGCSSSHVRSTCVQVLLFGRPPGTRDVSWTVLSNLSEQLGNILKTSEGVDWLKTLAACDGSGSPPLSCCAVTSKS